VVDYAKPDRAPLLLIAGPRPHRASSVVYENLPATVGSPPRRTSKLFEDRPHFDGSVDGWTDVADYALT